MAKDRDYVLGTNDEEVARLGVQHRVWRDVVLQCWRDAGIGPGCRVLDVGAGPGYATVDLAEMVGPTGEVVALERSRHFVETLQETVRDRGLSHVKAHELDLMADELPGGNYDFSWCRWVATFVNDPGLLVDKLARALRPGGRAIFHEYGFYQTWSFIPERPNHAKFVEMIIKTWHTTGGKTDVGMELPALCKSRGFKVHSMRPHIFCIRPADLMWQWPASFIESGPKRMVEIGMMDPSLAEALKSEFADATRDPASLMLTPLVLELVAEKE